MALEFVRKFIGPGWQYVAEEEAAGGGGAAFNGGTITDPLTVENSDPAAGALVVQAAPAQSAPSDGALFEVRNADGDGTLAVTAQGVITMDGDGLTADTTGVKILGKTDGTGSMLAIESRRTLGGGTGLMNVSADYGVSIGQAPGNHEALAVYGISPAEGLLFVVYDENSDPVIEIRSDGTIHIQTGATIIADL